MHIQKQIDRLLTDQASQWVETLRTAGPREQEAFCEWLRQSRLHVEEFLEVMAIDQALSGLDADRRIDVQTLVRQMSTAVVPLQRPADVAAAKSNSIRPAWKWGTAFAAGVAVCAIAVAVFHYRVRPGQDVMTATGEQRTLALPDGSTVTLNGASQIHVAFSGNKRDVALRAGEAVFLVARDPSRPFRVHTSTAVVRALGTEFNVNHQPSGTIVSVLEGRVQIVAPKAVQDLSAGEQAQIEASGHIQKNARPDIAKAMSWRSNSMRFEDAPLEELIAEFNRHSALKMRLEGIEPGSRRYGGIFNVNDPNSLADILEREDDLTVERRAGEIVIRRGDQ